MSPLSAAWSRAESTPRGLITKLCARVASNALTRSWLVMGMRIRSWRARWYTWPQSGEPVLPFDRAPRPGDLVNGCTSSPDLFPRSCSAHDVCYQTTGVSRAQCDSELVRNAYTERPELAFSLTLGPRGLGWSGTSSTAVDPAATYYFAVRLFGWIFHDKDKQR